MTEKIPPYSIVFVTVPDKELAEELAGGIVEGKLAACVNIVPGLTSIYWWEEKKEKAEELLLLLKTRTALVPEIIEFVKRSHKYSVPETISIHVQEGNPSYLDWLGANTLFTKPVRRDGPSRT